ncbi:MAG: aldo/keto reductase [Oscillospiraceae bacterium]
MKKLGFGCMRLPMADGQVDQEQFERMIDRYMAEGFRYFDTAHVYLDGASETALREGLVKRYPRDSFILTDKLSGSCYEKREDIRPLFEKQLAACGVTYFDYYLIHAVTSEVYEQCRRCGSFEVVKQLRDEGRIRHIGISFHDSAAMLETVLTEHPEIEVVQIQLNYADIDSASIQSGAVYEVCRRFGKPVLVMEPVKGGALANLPPEAERVLNELNGGSPASYAIRYAASFEGVYMVLSGMSTIGQMEDNLSFMTDFRPLDDRERAAIDKVRGILRAENTIPCTACRYCVPGCPMDIPIPDLFACLNTVRRYNDWSSRFYYSVAARGHGRASDCIGCRQCEGICPQHLPVTEYLAQAAEAFETEEAE